MSTRLDENCVKDCGKNSVKDCVKDCGKDSVKDCVTCEKRLAVGATFSSTSE